MEVETEVFRLLRDQHRLIETHKDQRENGEMTQLDKETSQIVENGCLFAQYMLKLNEVSLKIFLLLAARPLPRAERDRP